MRSMDCPRWDAGNLDFHVTISIDRPVPTFVKKGDQTFLVIGI